jgi:hypothetical protein
MAKNSHTLAFAFAAVLSGASVVEAAGLPMRAPPVEDRAALALAETLRFKLARPAAPDAAVWAALVNETIFMAQHLGLVGEQVVVPQRVPDGFMAVIVGRGVVAGRDADEVLGRLLYFLASDDRAAAVAAPIAIADQKLSATLSYLVSTLR